MNTKGRIKKGKEEGWSAYASHRQKGDGQEGDTQEGDPSGSQECLREATPLSAFDFVIFFTT